MQGGQLDMKKCFRRMGSFYFEKYWDLFTLKNIGIFISGDRTTSYRRN